MASKDHHRGRSHCSGDTDRARKNLAATHAEAPGRIESNLPLAVLVSFAGACLQGSRVMGNRRRTSEIRKYRRESDHHHCRIGNTRDMHRPVHWHDEKSAVETGMVALWFSSHRRRPDFDMALAA